MIPTKECMDILAKDGYIVLLTASPNTIMERLSRKNDRMFPNGRPSFADIEEMLRQRQEYFSDASHLAVGTDSKGVDEAAQYIADCYREYLCEQ